MLSRKFLLILILVLIICPISVSAAEIYSDQNFNYTIEDNSITITGCFGGEDEYRIPAVIAGKPVNTIAASAFTGPNIKRLYLPDTITEIEEGAISPGIVIYYAEDLPAEVSEESAVPFRDNNTLPHSNDLSETSVNNPQTVHEVEVDLSNEITSTGIISRYSEHLPLIVCCLSAAGVLLTFLIIKIRRPKR